MNLRASHIAFVVVCGLIAFTWASSKLRTILDLALLFFFSFHAFCATRFAIHTYIEFHTVS